jgi:glycosyltransferase involved in cell wall biosynthesis
MNSPGNERKIKVLHMIETSGPGGAENMLIRLICGLDEEKYDSVTCLLKDGWLRHKLEERNIETLIFPQKRCIDISWLITVIKYIKKHNVRMLHTHEFAMNVNGSLLSQLINIPCVTTVHGKNYYTDKWYRKVAYRFVSRQSYMVTVSEDIKNYLLENISINKNNIHIVINGINTDDYKFSKDRRKETRGSLGVNDKNIIIGAIGNLYVVKGHIYLVEAAKIVCSKYPEARFIIAGRGNQRNKLEAKIDELDLRENFSLLGFREDVPDMLNAFDIYVMSSLSEGTPLSILEAMSSNIPIVSTNVGGIKRIIQDGINGSLVNAKDSEQLADAIIRLIEDHDKANMLARNASELVKNDYSMAKMLAVYENIYNSLIK